MSYGPVQVFAASVASGTTFSSMIDLQKAYNKVSLLIPTMSSGTDVYLRGAPTLTGTSRRIYHAPNTVSSVVGAQFVGSAVTQCIVPFNNVHVQFIQVELTTTVTGVMGFQLLCSD